MAIAGTTPMSDAPIITPLTGCQTGAAASDRKSRVGSGTLHCGRNRESAGRASTAPISSVHPKWRPAADTRRNAATMPPPSRSSRVAFSAIISASPVHPSISPGANRSERGAVMIRVLLLRALSIRRDSRSNSASESWSSRRSSSAATAASVELLKKVRSRCCSADSRAESRGTVGR